VAIAQRAFLPTFIALAGVVAPAVAQERVAHELGEIEFLVRRAGVVVAAPHGTYDANTAALALEAARRLDASYVLARRFVVEGVRINVNRPSEGADLTCARESRSARSRDVYRHYARAVGVAAQGQPLALYVEIHGNSNPQTSGRFEIATQGISRAQALALKDAWPRMLARVRDKNPDYPAFAVLVEPADRIHYGAGCLKRIGIASTEIAPRLVHFELPRSARERPARDATTLLIIDVVRRLLGER
jgi:hypothetical protein